ncbi:hypothetical protein CPBF424_01910 [Xanthomonas euroxanthea]|uniref:Uncharacterized protein n=1 Tax=Xanthomonas euroxanthea TaxID=2259622 RepID=A0AA46C4U5_9XANT|nr:hypothetical protein CPBF424_01910 [Xanthomonas euroxanthea]
MEPSGARGRVYRCRCITPPNTAAGAGCGVRVLLGAPSPRPDRKRDIQSVPSPVGAALAATGLYGECLRAVRRSR